MFVFLVFCVSWYFRVIIAHIKGLFLAVSVTLFFVCHSNISKTTERICAKFTGNTCLVPCLLWPNRCPSQQLLSSYLWYVKEKKSRKQVTNSRFTWKMFVEMTRVWVGIGSNRGIGNHWDIVIYWLGDREGTGWKPTNQLRWVCLYGQIDIIRAVVIVWRVRGKIIRSVLCNIVYNNCTQWTAHTYEQT